MKVAIIGAGAAGCFTAANIPGRPGWEVTVYEKTGKALQKVKVSGGGRCNVTHYVDKLDEMFDAYPRGRQLLRKTLNTFGPAQTIRWFADHGVQLKTESDGRMFPVSDSSQTIIDCLWGAMMKQGVIVRFHKSVTNIARHADAFLLSFADGSTATADAVVISAGGFPKAEQYDWLRPLGHTIVAPVPSLFTFNMPGHPITGLMGVATHATVKIAGTKLQTYGPLLITHWGMSGPAILKASALGAQELAACNYQFRIIVNWLGNTTEEEWKTMLNTQRKTAGGTFVQQRNPTELPRRLWEYITTECGITDQTRWGDLPAAAQNKLTEKLLRDVYQVSGKTTFKEEFVTCGGINTGEINPQTMESRLVPGLYFAGELLNVDGITGGYNFQHAWSSAWLAANAISTASPSSTNTQNEQS